MREKNESLPLRNRLREVRTAQGLSQSQLADMVGVSRNTISSIETGQFSPTAKLALLLCIALDRKFEDLFYYPLKLYDADREKPVLLEAGQYIKFAAVTEEEYKKIEKEVEDGTYKYVVYDKEV